jgi:hypothetical protein
MSEALSAYRALASVWTRLYAEIDVGFRDVEEYVRLTRPQPV